MNKKKILHFTKIIGTIIAGVGLIGCFLGYYGHVRFSSVKASNRQHNQRLAPEKTDFKIAVFGDFAMQSGVAAPIMKDISESDADFVICTGDIFRHPNVGSALYLRELFDKNLHKPYYCVPGNHDLSEDGKKSLVYYRLFYHGDEQYCLGYGDTLFIMLNSADNAFDEQRFKYLERMLQKFRDDYRRCILVTHIPPVDVVPQGKYYNEELKEKLLPVIEKYRITGIICGHLHVAETLDFAGVPVYISHTSGQSNRDKNHPDFGYLMLHFKADGTIEESYVFKPELERSRNYFYGFIHETIYGKFSWFFLPAGLFVSGMIIFFIAAAVAKKRDTEKKPPEDPSPGDV